MSSTGAVFSLQIVQPQFIGALYPETQAGASGWIHLSFFRDSSFLELVPRDGKQVLRVASEIALSLAATLQVAVAHGAYLSNSSGEWRLVARPLSDGIAVEVGTGPRAAMLLSWPSESEGIQVGATDDQLNVRLRDDLALQIGCEMVRLLGWKAAQR